MTAPSLPLGSTDQEIDSALLHLPAERRPSMLALACLVFFTTCGALLRDWQSFPGQLLVVGVVVIGGVTLYFFRRPIAARRRALPDAVSGD